MALALSRQGLRVVGLDVRAPASPVAGVEFTRLDLADLAAIRDFAAAWTGRGEPIDVLVNNAGLVPSFQRAQTAQGLELGFGVSVAGHFALTGLLLPALLRGAQPRIVTTSSIAHNSGRLDFGDLAMARDYDPIRAYANAKLAALMHALELDRRARTAGRRLLSMGAHPGVSRTSIGETWERTPVAGWRDRLARLAFRGAMRWISQSAEQGAAPLLHAATAADAAGGEYYGPSGLFHWRGAPKRTTPSTRARDPAAAARLWQVLEETTQVHYDWSAR